MSKRDVPPMTSPDPARWWGEFSLERETWGHWRVGPLSLWVGRTEHEWRIAFARDDDPLRDECRVSFPAELERESIPADAEQRRVAYSRTSEQLELRPLLADRPVVARPETSVCIPPRQRVSVFISSSVWIRLGCGPQREPLLEIPTWRASDTWFGDNRSGFLCYATRSAMRLRVEEMPILPHRAITTVVIDNQGGDPLNIERVSLPVPRLSVFATRTGALWTERVLLTRREDAELAHVHIESGIPPRPDAVRVSEPRTASEDDLLSRVFTGLFG